MGVWTLFDYVELSGKNPIRDWLDGLPLKDQAKIDERLRAMEQLDIWSEKWASKYEGTDEIYEFRITGNKIQYRPLGTYYGRRQYVILAGAIERGDKIPKRDIETAKRRLKKISGVAQVMSSRINSKVNAIWKKLRNKEYRDSFVASQISNTIAAQIFSLRDARGWKQAEVAAKAGMKQSRISDLEDPNYENYETRTLVKLASAFDVGLIVRFVPFSELAKWSVNLSPRDFLPTEFLKDGIAPEIEDMTEFHTLPEKQIRPEASGATAWAVPVSTPNLSGSRTSGKYIPPSGEATANPNTNALSGWRALLPFPEQGSADVAVPPSLFT